MGTKTFHYIFRNLVMAGLALAGIGLLFLVFYKDRYFQSGTYSFTPNKGWTILSVAVVLLLACWIVSRIARVKSVMKSKLPVQIGTIFSVLSACAVIWGCVWFVLYLDGLSIDVSPEKFGCKNQNSGAAFEWSQVTNVQGNVAPWYEIGQQTDQYSWVNLFLGDLAIHMPLSFFPDKEFIIDQVMTYWSQAKTP